MPDSKLQQAVNEALRDHVRIFGVYLLSPADVIKIVVIVLKILNTLTTPECTKCISELVQDVQGN